MRQELALDDPRSPASRPSAGCGDDLADAEPLGHGVRRERAVRAGVAADEIAERIAHGLAEHLGQPGGIGTPSASRRRLRSSTATNHVAGEPHLGDARRRRARRAAAAASVDSSTRSATSSAGERPELAEEVGDALLAARGALGIEPLEHPLGLVDHLGVEELAELDRAEQLGQQRRVERERGRAPLGERGVALVHERADVPEEQARGERARGLGGDLDEPDLAAPMRSVSAGERGQVVDVLQALAHRLEHDREVGEVARDLEQLRGALALLPERGAAARVEARQQQRRAAHSRKREANSAEPPTSLGHELGELGRLEREQLGARRLVGGVGHAQHDAVVARDRRSRRRRTAPDARARGERPRRVHAHAVRRVQHDAPVAQLVAEALDDEVGGVGHDPRRRRAGRR